MPSQYQRLCTSCETPGFRVKCANCGHTGFRVDRSGPVEAEEDDGPWEVSGPLTKLTNDDGDEFYIPTGKVCGFFGDNGGGKSTVAMLTLPQADFCTTEMDKDLVLRYRRRLRKTQDRKLRVRVRIFVPWFASLEDAASYDVREGDMLGFLDADSGAHVDPYTINELIFDSVSESPRQSQVVEWLIKWTAESGARAIAVFWQTAEGDIWGGSTDAHRLHSRLQFTKDEMGVRTAIVHKDRLPGVTGSCTFALGNDDSDDPEVDAQYVSVEGKGGRYVLVPWPGAKSKEHASIYRALEPGAKFDKAHVERLDELPQPPCAVAARYAHVYAGGWVEPKDWRDRARLALRRGYTYFSPLHGVIEDVEALNEV